MNGSVITKSIKLDRRRAPRRRAGHDPRAGAGAARVVCSFTFNTKKRISIGANIRPVGDLAGPRPRRFIRFRDGGRESSNFFNRILRPAHGAPPRGRRAGCRGAVAAAASAEPDPASRPPVRRVAPREGNGRDMTRTLMDTLDRIPPSSSSYRLHTHATRMSQRPSSFFARSARANLRFRSRKPLFVGHAASAAPHRDDIISP